MTRVADTRYPSFRRLMEAVRRERLLRRMKQSHLAELMKVAQSSVSRWESGVQIPSGETLDRLAQFLAASPVVAPSTILIRLVEQSEKPVHLVCDDTHRLLAASRVRRAAWRLPREREVPLWPYASREIRRAEERLAALGWHERPDAAVFFRTGGRADPDVPIEPGIVLWERVPMGGSFARLVTTLAEREAPPEGARPI